MRASLFVFAAFSVVACAAAPAQTSAASTTSVANQPTIVAFTTEPKKQNVGVIAQEVPATTVPATNNSVAESKKFETPEAMLSALEKAGDTISTFRANVIYDRVDAVSENRERRKGQIVLTQKAGDLKSRKLAIMFDQLIDASGHATTERQRFVFAGGWLFEFDDQRHQLIARELVPPGEQLDPLRIGEGPIPIPIGQKKEQVCQRFEVKFAPQPVEQLLKRLENIQGLALHPKQNAGVDPDLADICVWYDLTTLMPVAVKAMTKGGDEKILLLTKIEVNKDFEESTNSLLSTEPPTTTSNGPVWRQDVRPYKDAP